MSLLDGLTQSAPNYAIPCTGGQRNAPRFLEDGTPLSTEDQPNLATQWDSRTLGANRLSKDRSSWSPRTKRRKNGVGAMKSKIAVLFFR